MKQIAFTTCEDRRIRRCYGKPDWANRLAMELGRHVCSVYKRAKELECDKEFEMRDSNLRINQRDDRTLAIWTAIRTSQGITRSQISEATGYGIRTVDIDLNYLLSKKMIFKRGYQWFEEPKCSEELRIKRKMFMKGYMKEYRKKNGRVKIPKLPRQKRNASNEKLFTKKDDEHGTADDC